MFQALLKKLASALKKAGIPYMIIGGQAVLLYGEPRLTRDIDVTMGIGVEDLAKARELARSLGLTMLKDDEIFVKRTMVMPLLEDTSGIRIDLVFSFSPYERQAIARARAVDMDGTTVMFAALEDLLIHKLVAGRPRDLEDARTLLLRNKSYDQNYVSKWLCAFDTSLGGNLSAIFEQLEKETV